MSSDLRQRTLKGLFWSGFERVTAQAVTFVLTLILARLVSPDDYGTLAIVMVFVALSEILVDSGFANALVRKQDCSDVDRSTVLYFNIVVAVLMYALLYVSAPLIASFYDNELLRPLVRYTSLIIVVNSLSIVQKAILTSKIDFKKQTIVTLTSSIVGGAVGVALAYKGYGVVALVSQAILVATVRTILLWVLVWWQPMFVFSRSSFDELFGYSYKLMLSGLIVGGANQIIQLLMGKFFSLSTLGYYNYSKRVADFPSTNISSTIQRVLFASFSQIQNDDRLLSEKFRESLVVSMSIIFPIMFGLSMLCEPIIELLLTPQWRPTIPLLRIVSITMAFWPLLMFNINILWVKKRSDLSLMLEVINTSIKLVVIISLFRYGILAVCAGLTLVTIINFFTYAYFISNISSYSFSRQIKDILRVMLKPLLASILSYFVIEALSAGNLAKIIFGYLSIFVIDIALVVLFKGYDYDLLRKYSRQIFDHK